MRKVIIILSVILIILTGILLGFLIYNNGKQTSGTNIAYNGKNDAIQQINEIGEISSIQTSVEEGKTTPNTLIIYKTYYTKCKHYIQKYENIDVSLVNLSEKEFKEKTRNWDIDKFGVEEIELSKEVESFCDEHYKLKLENNVIVVYKVDELGIETEYEQTGITTEYLTNEDILKLTTGIYVYGKENLTSTIEDYE